MIAEKNIQLVIQTTQKIAIPTGFVFVFFENAGGERLGVEPQTNGGERTELPGETPCLETDLLQEKMNDPAFRLLRSLGEGGPVCHMDMSLQKEPVDWSAQTLTGPKLWLEVPRQ